MADIGNVDRVTPQLKEWRIARHRSSWAKGRGCNSGSTFGCLLTGRGSLILLNPVHSPSAQPRWGPRKLPRGCHGDDLREGATVSAQS